MRAPATSWIWPASRCSWPIMSLSKVDLPAPFVALTQPTHFFLLAFVLLCQERTHHHFRLDIGIVIARILFELTRVLVNLPNAVVGAIENLAIMPDDQHPATLGRKIAFQPFH